MTATHPPHSAAAAPRAPFHETELAGQAVLRHFAAAFFSFALIADLAYVRTVLPMWQDIASWMLLAGLMSGGAAVLLWLASLALRRHRPVWGAVLLGALALLAAFVNSLVHAGDGWTAIVPWGISLSAVTCLLMLASAALRRAAIARHRY